MKIELNLSEHEARVLASVMSRVNQDYFQQANTSNGVMAEYFSERARVVADLEFEIYCRLEVNKTA
jgi:hypothetical protein